MFPPAIMEILIWSNFIGEHVPVNMGVKAVNASASGLRSYWSDQAGSALIEGALIIPVLFLLMFGVYEFSWFFYQQQLVATGVRGAARYLARSGSACSNDPTTRIADEARARRLATTGAIDGGNLRVRGWAPSTIRISCTAIPNVIDQRGLPIYRGGPAIKVVTVSTRFADPALGFFGLLHLPAPMQSASHSERVIGPG